MKTRQCAFTLIELLVVIAIIAILAACCCRHVQGQATAKVAQCVSHFRQLQLCYKIYCDDNQEFCVATQVRAWDQVRCNGRGVNF